MTDNDPFLYTGSKTKEISFPLGGIGTGSIGLGGDGRLIDWEIFNRPNKGSVNGFSHFAIKVEKEGKVLDTRVLHGDLNPPYSGSFPVGMYNGFGFGPSRESMMGAPHFQEVRFQGQFPVARLEYIQPGYPGSIALRAFNPFIPLNDRDSSLPAAFLEFEITNTTADTLEYTLAGTLHNPLPAPNLNTRGEEGIFPYLHLETTGLAPDDLNYGSLTLATDAYETSFQEYWFRGAWYDSLGVYWHDLSTPGRLKNRRYEGEKAGAGNPGTLAAHVTVQSGQRSVVRFVIAWFFPNRANTWNAEADRMAKEKGIQNQWKNYYAALFSGSRETAIYGLRNWRRLSDQTEEFKQTLFASSLPSVVMDAVSANLAVLKSATVLRLEDGSFYGFEGCHAGTGCCEGSCTHVWNYNQALPFLFPNLERSMRQLNFRYNQRPDGGMRFRLALPLELTEMDFVPRPCADGQFGDVLKTYRDWKISGDTKWLRSLWPAVKKAMAYAWSPENPDRWDPEKSGVLTGRQHHTLDMELFGPNSWLTGFYLAALKAAAEIADKLGEADTAGEYRQIFERGKAWVDKNLFNGEYYFHQVTLDNRTQLDGFNAQEIYWDEEHQEVKYQVGEGCLIDQVLAQWHADLYGLGDVFDAAQTKTALHSLYQNNFKSPFREYFNPCRIFALNGESGLVMCSWPERKREPIIPVPYSQEVMTGFEYSAAGLMIQRGMMEEGIKIIAAVRERYDGEKRNPWNEIECGSNYARTLAAYAFLNIFSGFSFDMTGGQIGFNPIRVQEGHFQCLWSLDCGWGSFVLEPGRVILKVNSGWLTLNSLALPFVTSVNKVECWGEAFPFEFKDGILSFPEPAMVESQGELVVQIG